MAVMSSGVRNNPVLSRFELDVGGEIAAAYYRRQDGVMTFTHTEVPAALQGQGIASRLIGGALEAARADGLKVVPRCPFVSAYMGRHPEFNDLLA